MFDRLDDMLIHYEELMLELNNPSVAEDQNRFRRLMKEQADLAPIVEAYQQYKKSNQDIEDSVALLEEENDEEMRELAKEELSDARKRVEELEQQLKILLLPKDPNDDKNIILEIRAGAGGILPEGTGRLGQYCQRIRDQALPLQLDQLGYASVPDRGGS